MGTSLVPIDQGQDRSFDADVVFVHGLGGNWQTTWLSRDEETPTASWPYWLAEKHREWAIWSLDYAAEISNWRGKGLLGWLRPKGRGMAIPELGRNALHTLLNTDIGERPAFFVCHSLGGLVVKAVLAEKDTEEGEKVFAVTQGVVFIATPHDGSQLSSLAKRLPRKLARQTRTVEEMERNGPHLQKLKTDYSRDAVDHGIATLVYVETEPTFGTQVVEKSSADPGVSGISPVPVTANHLTIVKPTSLGELVPLGVERFVKGVLGSHTNVPTKTAPDDLATDGDSAEFEIVMEKKRARFAGGNQVTATELWAWALDRKTDDRRVKVRSLYLEDETEKHRSLTEYREFREITQHLERALNYLTAERLRYWSRRTLASEQTPTLLTPDDLIEATLVIHNRLMRGGWPNHGSFWAGPPSLQDQISFYLPEEETKSVHTGYYEDDLASPPRKQGLPRSRPLELDWLPSRTVWRYIAPEVIVHVTEVASTQPDADITGWVFSDRPLDKFSPEATE